jgi:hypothetical protein
VRDPLARQLSAWKMYYSRNKSYLSRVERQRVEELRWASKGFDYWMRMQRDVKQWDTCCYKYQLAAYEELFPAQNICVSFLEDWKQSQESEVKRIMTFLELDPDAWYPDGLESANRATDRRIERSFLRKIRTLPPVREIVKQMPSIWRKHARLKLATTKVHLPEALLDPQTRDSFVVHVAEDARSFLSQHGKDLELWSELFKGNVSKYVCL